VFSELKLKDKLCKFVKIIINVVSIDIIKRINNLIQKKIWKRGHTESKIKFCSRRVETNNTEKT